MAYGDAAPLASDRSDSNKAAIASASSPGEMPFSAIICATRPHGDSPESLSADVHFAGQSLLEYQVRQASEAGAGRILIVVSSVTQLLSRAIDRLSADGLDVSLIRDVGALLRQAPRDQDFLLIGDAMVVPQRFLNGLAGQAGNGLLVVEATGPAEGFDRIDGMHRWGGAARVSPGIFFGTLDLVGDWDLQLTLVRAIVQAGASRTVAPQDEVLEGRLAQVESQASADLVSHALLTQSTERVAMGRAGAERYVLRPLASGMAVALMRSQVPPAQVSIAGAGLGVIGGLACIMHWPLLAMLILLLAVIVNEAADHLSNLARRPGLKGWLAYIPDLAVLAGIWLLGGEAGRGREGLYLALMLGILLLRHRAGPWLAPAWSLFTPGTALAVMAITTICGYFDVGLTFSLMAAILSVGVALLSSKAQEISRFS